MKVFLVGGAVRDQLLGLPVKERDWVVVGATPEDMLTQGYQPVGQDFPVFIHPQTGEEYALARTERKTAPGYKGFVFHTDPEVSLEQDLQRRDLTVNAIAMDEQGQLIDPYGGQQDLETKCLRHVSAAFAEDPVRILRVARFMARYHHLGFTLATETLSLMKTMVNTGETRHLVAERVWQECRKALAEKSPQQFFILLEDCGALTDIFPGLSNDLLPQCLDNLLAVKPHSADAESRFAALCYPLSEDALTSLCHHLAVPTSYRELARLLNRWADSITQREILTAKDIANLLRSVDASRKPERFLQIVAIVEWLPLATNGDNLNVFWQAALNAYDQVDVQALIAQGYTKAALGEALFDHRIERIAEFKKNLG